MEFNFRDLRAETKGWEFLGWKKNQLFFFFFFVRDVWDAGTRSLIVSELYGAVERDNLPRNRNIEPALSLSLFPWLEGE